MCAVLVLTAAAPLAFADTHHIVKGAQGPRASAETWDFVAPDYGMWYGRIVNNGLRSLVIDVYDVSAGASESISHERIRFAAVDAFPTGEVSTAGVIMAAGRAYEITVTPNGPKDSFCDIADDFDQAVNPVADFSTVIVSKSVSFNAGASLDPDGSIVSYEWVFGDGQIGSGVMIDHMYASLGSYDVTLTVRDNENLPGTVTKTIVLVDDPPVAMFSVTSSVMTVSVDATDSSDDFGIVSYLWAWGDGTTSEGMTATHTYVLPGASAPASLQSSVRQPIPPYNVQGMTLDLNGNGLPGCEVTITNEATGVSIIVMSDPEYGWYEYDLNNIPGGWLDGDLISVTATSPGWVGSASGIASSTQAYLGLDIWLHPTVMQYTITLTVTDVLGQTATMTQVVELLPA